MAAHRAGAALEAMLAMIEDDLAALGIRHDVFFSERSLSEGPRDEVAETIADLKAKGLIYKGRLPPPKGKVDEDWEDREQLLFRATEFGDDIDRPLVKSDGSYAYFAGDIAYHRDKFRRGFNTMIDVFGADHSRSCQTDEGGGGGSDRWRGHARHQDLSACSLVSRR